MTKPTHELSPALIVLMSVATGLAVASNYYAQPLLDTIAHHFSLSASSAGFIVTAAQLGYAAGLLFLVPLGDMFERRTLIVSMTLLAAGGMLITASSQSLSMMILGTALTGLFSVVAQILVPLAATLATPATRGKVVGTIMSGLLLGILLARTVAGLLANLGGWRTVFWVASALMALMAVVPATDLWVDANFKETQLANMRIGQPVTVITDIYGDDVKYTGKVVGLDMGTGSAFSLLPAQNATGNWIKVVQRLPVRVELDARQLEQHPLRIGLSTLVTVDTANRDGQVLASQVRTTPVAESNAREINLAPVNKLIDDIVQANAG
ncbi:MFS transporter [Salmonella enterica subsp. enterica serovar Typhimurium]|nr:MFS transporter [Salmonella enterica subsp. enterica serovar Typhimurium]